MGRPLFLYFRPFYMQVTVSMFNKSCRWMYSNLGLLVSGINSEYFIQYLGDGFSINFGISLLKANSNSSKWPKVELMIYPSGRTEHGLIQIYSIELKKFVVPLNYFGLTIVHSCDLYIQCFFWTLRKYLLQLCLSKLLYKLLDCL